MVRTLLKSKIHRIKITGADLHYEGSLTLDEAIMEAANLVPFEKIEIYNVNNGNRFSTYVIPGVRYGGECILNGAAARLGHYGDIIIIASYAQVSDKELSNFHIDLVYIDEKDNTIKEHKKVKAISNVEV
ncbi:aspartate 1-decarboxylase [Venenivibrio stagnispumantis]|uniref:Aspartate 1-decarboxylase n=1 Tax=Venenivibrio stagnispumantis TaxID=407998 RepID=A0AA46ADI5_9AQUI|nr:aspartate 1-decarboxylase [Venenivibrio stagnispumantis]MCW4572973.1 aspartate 1-decarboxylase [Venenivibrio stagnispumantis]SMP05469.1 L-aspartate 1-decarboxylase [Venenivibrio stagnispumantis]